MQWRVAPTRSILIARREKTIQQSRSVRSLMLGAALVIAAIAIGAAMMVSSFRERALADSQRELENTVLLLTRHFDRQLADFEVVQKDIIAQADSAALVSPEAFKREMSTFGMHLILKARINGASDVAGVNVFDSDGTLINSSESWPVPAVNVADRAYFKAFKSGSATTPVLIEMVQSRLIRAWIAVVSRKVAGPNGEFLGLVTRGIRPADFESFFASVALGEGASIGLFHADGTLLARHPHVEAMIGRNFMNAPVHQQILSKTDHGSLQLDSPIDDKLRLASARRLEQFPLSVVATTTVSAALAGWKEQTKFLIGVAGLSVLVVAGMLFLLVRQLSRDHRLSSQRLELEKQQLDMVVNNMTQGLLLFDSSERLVVCNQAFVEMYGLSPDVVRPGCSFRDLLAHRKETGSFDGDVDEFCASILRRVALASVTHEVIETADGRSIQTVIRPLANGGWVVTHEDISERRRSDERIAHLAHYDAMTDLPNRVLFGISLLRTLVASATTRDHVALFMLDLDAFQEINDAVGVPTGDAVLCRVSKRISDFAERHEGYAARSGGDEFAVFFAFSTTNDKIQGLAADLCRELAQPLVVDDREFQIEACVGAAIFPFPSEIDLSADELGMSELMKRAAIALQAAKRAGRGTHRLYSADLDDRQRDQMILRQSLRKAIEKQQFELHYHPLVDLKSGKIVGAEALVRWSHPTLGMQRPDIFIPLAERSGLIVPLGAWVLHEAMRQAEEWRHRGITVPKIAINVSGIQLLDPDFLRNIERSLALTGAKASQFEIELTEGFMIEASVPMLDILRAMKTMGFTLAVDDFGTGHSSFRYLRDFPVDKVKIDQTFVRQMVIDSSDASIIRAIIALGRSLNLDVVAEGIETTAQRNFLRDEGCRTGQGYLFSLPLAAEDFEFLLARGVSLPMPSSKGVSGPPEMKVA